jgi:hypothetical protein
MTRPGSPAALLAGGERGLNGSRRGVTERIATIGPLWVRLGADRDPDQEDRVGLAVRRVADVVASRPGGSRVSRGHVYRDLEGLACFHGVDYRETTRSLRQSIRPQW